MEDLVEDHLRESTAARVSTITSTWEGDVLEFHGLSALADLLRDILDLDDGVGLDDAKKVLLEKGVVQRGEVCADRRV